MRRLDKISGIKYQHKGTKYTVGFKTHYNPKNGQTYVDIGVNRMLKTNLGRTYQWLPVFHGIACSLDTATMIAIQGAEIQPDMYGLKKIMYKNLRKYIQKKVSHSQFSILAHSLGMPRARRGLPYRNYYQHNPTWDLDQLVEKGYLRHRVVTHQDKNYDYYHVTMAGMEVVLGKEYCKRHKEHLEDL